MRVLYPNFITLKTCKEKPQQANQSNSPFLQPSCQDSEWE